jgi:hypothetical protein
MRDTAFKFKQQGIDITKSMLNNITANRTAFKGVYTPGPDSPIDKDNNPFLIDNPYSKGKEDIRWLL